ASWPPRTATTPRKTRVWQVIVRIGNPPTDESETKTSRRQRSRRPKAHQFRRIQVVATLRKSDESRRTPIIHSPRLDFSVADSENSRIPKKSGNLGLVQWTERQAGIRFAQNSEKIYPYECKMSHMEISQDNQPRFLFALNGEPLQCPHAHPSVAEEKG